eukprot:365852-Chlamydomonas_euryale.AAC.4
MAQPLCESPVASCPHTCTHVLQRLHTDRHLMPACVLASARTAADCHIAGGCNGEKPPVSAHVRLHTRAPTHRRESTRRLDGYSPAHAENAMQGCLLGHTRSCVAEDGATVIGDGRALPCES